MDIDIDVANRDTLLGKIKHCKAALKNGKSHNTGIYVTEIPSNPITKISTIDYKTAEKRGYFKIDILNVGMYHGIRDEKHLIELMNKEPIWELLKKPEFTKDLFHVSGHHETMRILEPDSPEKLAAALAIIRPAKKYLLGEDWNTILKEVWVKPNNEQYYFKKSHGIAYAFAVIVHMNLKCEKILESESKI